MRTKYWVMLAAIALVMAQGTSAYAAALNSNQASVALNGVMNETLTVSAAPATVNFTPLNPNGVTNGDSAITINTAWVLASARADVYVYAYFATTTALTNGTDNIPVSNVSGSVNAGAPTAFTGNSPFGTGTSLSIVDQKITGTNKNSSRSDTLSLTVDTTGMGYSAGTYTGTLFIQADAI
jgi:hypothetical protein